MKRTTSMPSLKRALTAGTSVAALLLAAPVVLAQADTPNIVTIDGVTPADSLDTATDITGIGMFYRADGFVCSGTLINPRTVLFAAHCVNDIDGSVYGNGLPAAWSFGANALPGFATWANNGFNTNTQMAVYNVAQVIWNAASVARPEGQGFLEGDVALSVLDTPAGDIPTWALLFSALPAPDGYTQETGSGYHVNLVGYGRSGEGSLGAYQGVDWRRRAAENFIGALASLDDRNLFLFGTPPGSLPQNLYQLDFDDPNRTNPFDFDLFRGDAAPNEGITSGGDSGGPLILDAAENGGINEDLVIGVLSGGSRFFGPQDFSTYGTSDFYQPLYLFWDWIAENNPYRYVGATEGDGAWEDPDRWYTLMDPNYRIINENGNVVNGIPNSPGEGVNDTSEPWGEICFAPVVCETLETGAVAPYADATAGTDGNAIGTANIGIVTIDGVAQTAKRPVSDAEVDADAAGNADAFGPLSVLPAATIENGLPGATGFTVDNINAGGATIGRYFDVTLANAGTTTLSSTVEIDRFTLANLEATLDIQSDGSLTNLIDITQSAGWMNVDGSLTTYGDYLLLSGLLTGSGTINTPYLTSVMGLIAPGGTADIGTLTVNGNVILSSGSGLAINYGAGGVDQLAVTGVLSLGGTLLFVPTSGLPRYGDGGTFLSAGSITGVFDSVPTDLPGVLFQTVTIENDQASFTIQAESFVDHTTYTNHLQASLGFALDDARDTDYDALSDLFGPVDLLSGDALATAFNSLSPFEAVMFDRTARSHTEALNAALLNQLGGASNAGATDMMVAMASAERHQDGISDRFSMGGAKSMFRNPFRSENAAAPGFRAFGDIGYLQGDAELIFGAGSADIEGHFTLIGMEAVFDTGWSIGGALGMANSDMDGPASIGQITSETTTTQLTGFVGYNANRLNVTGYASMANSDMAAQRQLNLGGSRVGTNSDLHSDTTGFGLEANYQFTGPEAAIQIVPSFSLAYSEHTFDSATTSGGAAGLTLAERKMDSLITRLGAHFSMETGAWRPMAYLGAAHDFGDNTEAYGASFTAAPTVSFGTVESIGNGRVWYDVALGVERVFGNGAALSLSAQTEIGRGYLEQESVKVSFSLPF